MSVMFDLNRKTRSHSARRTALEDAGYKCETSINLGTPVGRRAELDSHEHDLLFMPHHPFLFNNLRGEAPVVFEVYAAVIKLLIVDGIMTLQNFCTPDFDSKNGGSIKGTRSTLFLDASSLMRT